MTHRIIPSAFSKRSCFTVPLFVKVNVYSNITQSGQTKKLISPSAGPAHFNQILSRVFECSCVYQCPVDFGSFLSSALFIIARALTCNS